MDARLPSQLEFFFNTKLAQARIRIEHCKGTLKSRFPCLRCLNIKIKKRTDIGKVVDIIIATAKFHNFLLEEPNVEQYYYDKMAERIRDDEPELFDWMLEPDEEPEARRDEMYNFIL